MSLQTASRCQPVPSLLFLQNKGRETCSGDLFTSRTISSYIMTQARLPANCCSEPGKTIRSPLRAASVHNAGFVPPCHQPWHVGVSPAHPLSSQEEVADGKEKPLPQRGSTCTWVHVSALRPVSLPRAGDTGDGTHLCTPSCPGSETMMVNWLSCHRAETALTLLLKMGWEVLVFGFLRFLVR